MIIVYNLEVAGPNRERAMYYIETSAARVPIVGDELELWDNGPWIKVHGVVLGLSATVPTHVYLATADPSLEEMDEEQFGNHLQKAGWTNGEWGVKGRGR